MLSCWRPKAGFLTFGVPGQECIANVLTRLEFLCRNLSKVPENQHFHDPLGRSSKNAHLQVIAHMSSKVGSRNTPHAPGSQFSQPTQ
jgi:hypothetical protein